MGDALDYAYRPEVVHRDMKPKSVLRPLVGPLLVALMCDAPAASAQLMVSRNVWPLTQAADSGGAGLLPRLDFYGEAQRGFGSTADELAWDIRYIGLLELWRWRNRSATPGAPYRTLIAVVGHQLSANPYNSIGFNPRGAIWEENLHYVRLGTTAEVDWRIEIGVHARGQRGGVTLLAAYEKTFDDVSRPTPQPSSVFGVGVRLQPASR